MPNAWPFTALGMELVTGRNFSEADTERTTRVAIVNEAMARHFFADVNAVGKQFREGGLTRIVAWCEIRASTA